MEARNNVNSVLCAWYVCRKALNYRGSKLYDKIVKKNPREGARAPRAPLWSPGSKGFPLATSSGPASIRGGGGEKNTGLP